MADSTDPDPAFSNPQEEMHWGFSYLREDIQDLRGELRGQIQQVRQDLRDDILGVRGEIKDVRGEVRDVRADVAGLQAQINVRFGWTIATMVLIAGAIVAAIKV